MKISNLQKEIKELRKLIKQQNENTFLCIGCANQHQQILDWLIELRDFEQSKIGINKENPLLEGFMTLDEAIRHAEEVAEETAVETSEDPEATEPESKENRSVENEE